MKTERNKDMEAALAKASAAGAQALDDLACRIAKEAPNLSDLSPEDPEKSEHFVF